MQEIVRTERLYSVWIVGQHPLAAEYLQKVLAEDPHIEAHWVRAKMPAKHELGEYPLFILDNVGLETSVSLYIRNLNTWLGLVKYIVLDDKPQHHNIYEWLSLGIHGFLTYEQVPESLPLAIYSVANGGTWVEPQILQKFMRQSRRDKCNSLESEPGLTLREEQIFHLAGQRFSNKEIAAKLKIEVSTVKFHLTNIFSKLQIKGKPDLWQEYSSEGMHNLIAMDAHRVGEHAS